MLRIQLLGSFQVSDADEPIARLQSERLQALLAYLVLHRDQPLSRQQLAVTFWPDTTDAQARTNLRTLLTRLREALLDADQCLAVDAQTVQWRNDSPFTLDVLEFEQALAANRLTDAIAAYHGDLLPGCYDDWITGERERLRQAYQHALDRLIQQAEQLRRLDRAIAYAQRLLRHDPLHETAYRHLMRLQLANGDRSGALRTYHACATMLRGELGVDPSGETRTLYAQLLKADAPSLEASPPLEPVRTPFVGRQAEWAQLLTTWRAASAGQPQLALITGEAGIGKTHLAEHLLAYLDRQNVATVVARCYATERATAYAPIGQWLRSDALRDRLNTLDPVWLTEVSRLAPWLHTDRPDLPTPGPLTEAWQRQRLFEALARTALIRREPILMFLDDVQWCDRETLDWLHYLLQFEATAPLLIVGTVRQEEADDNEALATWRLLLQKHDCLAEIPLARFDALTTSALASSLSEHDLQVDEAARIYRETEGNPLFVVEMMRAGGPTNDPALVVARSDAEALPPKVQATIQYRLSQLSASAQSLIQIAAVIGREFTFEVLAHASDANEDALVQGLDELWRKHIVREQGASAYDFSHDKIRVVACAALSATRRRMLHRKVAEALASVYATSLDAQSGSIAQHYEIAGLADRAVEFYRRAAQTALRIYANDEAIELYQRALDLAQGSNGRIQTQLIHEGWADVLERIGQHALAREHYRAALALIDDARASARVQRKLGNAYQSDDQYIAADQYYARAKTILEGMSAEQFAWSEWIDLQLDWMRLYYNIGDDSLAQLSEDLRLVIVQRGTPVQQGSFIQGLARANYRRDRYVISDETLKASRAALDVLRVAGQLDEMAIAQFGLGFTLLWRGDLSAALSEIQAAHELFQRTGNTVRQLMCLTYLMVAQRRLGNVAEVKHYIEICLPLATTQKDRHYIGAAEANLAWLAWRAGDVEQACIHGQNALQNMRAVYPVHWLALLPLLAIALDLDQLTWALELGSRLIDVRQLKLPDPIEPLIQQALSAWQAEDTTLTRRLLAGAIDHAQSLGYL